MKNLFKQYLWLIILVGLLVLGIGVYFLNGYLSEKSFDKTVNSQRNQANIAVQESKIESGAAANYSIERRTEDAIREKTITPKLGEARRQSEISKTNLANAQKQYEKAKTDLENLNRSIADNCADLKRLYPNTTFEYCSKR